MSPVNHNLDTMDTEGDDQVSRMSDMRRVSLSLAFSPTRHQRRKHMTHQAGWLRRFGLNRRRIARAS